MQLSKGDHRPIPVFSPPPSGASERGQGEKRTHKMVQNKPMDVTLKAILAQ
jgi:hypothetical protein